MKSENLTGVKWEQEQDSLVEDALDKSNAPEGWPEFSDSDVTGLTDDELGGIVWDAMTIAEEDGTDWRESVIADLVKSINRAKLWEVED